MSDKRKRKTFKRPKKKASGARKAAATTAEDQAPGPGQLDDVAAEAAEATATSDAAEVTEATEATELAPEGDGSSAGEDGADAETPLQSAADADGDDDSAQPSPVDAWAGEEAETQAADSQAPEDGGTIGDPESDPEARERLKRALESLIFVSDRVVTSTQLARAVKLRVAVVRPALAELMEAYSERGIQLVETAGGYQFRSSPACADFVREFTSQRPVRLTRAQLETLALVAYRQPITRPEVDEVRGVDTGSAVRVLLERNLIKILGRKDEAGRPLLYGTTPFFLEFFGLETLKDLPTLREFTELTDENRELFQRKTGESFEDAEAALAQQRAQADAEAEAEAAAELESELLQAQATGDAAGESVAPDGEHSEGASDTPSDVRADSDDGEEPPGESDETQSAGDATSSGDDLGDEGPAHEDDEQGAHVDA